MKLGKDGYFPPYSTVLDRFSGWQQNSNVLTLRFEDLVGSRGRGSDVVKQEVLQETMRYLGLQGVQIKTQYGVEFAKTPTLRKGLIGDWEKSFDVETLELCSEHIGGHLKRMGYA